MAVVTGTAGLILNFYEMITSGVITPQNLQAGIGIPASLPGFAALSFTNGTGAMQVDTVYGMPLTLSASTLTLDLTSLTDLRQNAINFARVRVLGLVNTDTTAAHTVKVYADATNGWAVLPPVANYLTLYANNGVIALFDPASSGSGNGQVVTSGSKRITLDPGANTITTVYLVLIGGSAA